MGGEFQDVTDAELAVLRFLWDHPGATIRQMTDTVYPRGQASDYATVQKLLERLESKDAVARQRQTPAHLFTATIDRDQLIGHRLRQMAEKICGGSLTPLLTHLVENEPLSDKEREALRRMLQAGTR